MYRARPADGEMPLKSASPPVNAMPMPNALRAGWTLAPHDRYSFVRVTKDLTEAQVDSFRRLRPAFLHNATVSISLQAFRDAEPSPYVVCGLSMIGTVDLPRGCSAVRILRL